MFRNLFWSKETNDRTNQRINIENPGVSRPLFGPAKSTNDDDEQIGFYKGEKVSVDGSYIG